MQTLKLTSEQHLLFNFLKGQLPVSLEGADPSKLFELFRRHRLFPLAKDILPLLEEKERDHWREAIQSRTLRSMHQLSVLSQITGLLEERGIRTISMKGPLLAYELFGNIGDRHSSDLDILARMEDMHRIIEILGNVGFELIYPKTGLSERQWKYYTRYKKDIGLSSREHKLLVEVHYNIENYMGLTSSDVKQFMLNPGEISMGGRSYYTMNRPYNFLYLIFHGAVHQYRRLFWLRDIAKAIDTWELDHEKILDDARRMGIDRMLGVSMVLVKDLFGSEVPEVYNSYLAENRQVIERLKRSSYRIILGPEFLDRHGKLLHHQYMLGLSPKIAHYLRTAGEILNRQYIGKFLGGH